jgi:hypothetical protein
MDPALVYLYDANPIDVRDRHAQLEEQLRQAGDLGRWQICASARG